ncbi:MAG: TRAP transporter substrate-binding protein DctP [Deltaproteobacteria bacterium]|nr:TRAP transporter substrate-binding protein DctP [Deltaproteobacteria bacterium]
MLKKFTVLAACLTLALAALAAPAAAETLRLQCAYPQNAYAGQTTQYFANEVKKLTKGEVEIKVFWPDQLVKTKEAFDAVRQGMVDAYSGSLLYFAGLVPEVNCQWLPYNWGSAHEALDVLLNKGYMDVMSQAVAKHGVTYLAPLSVATMGLLTKFPVSSLDDLKGKKIRAVGMEAQIVKALGASAVAISGAEQYMALQRGTVDGTDYPWYTVEKYKFYEVLEYIIDPAFHTPGVIEIVMNTEVFNKLTPEQQKAVKQAALNAMNLSFNNTPKFDQGALDAAKKRGIKVLTISAPEMKRFRKALEPLWDAQAKQSPLSAKLVEILRANLKAQGVN